MPFSQNTVQGGGFLNCLKCGKEAAYGQVFCPECQEEMERYPVNPNAPVILPKQKITSTAKKPPRKKIIPLEEQISTLKRKIRILLILLIAVIILAAVLAYPAVLYLKEDHFLPGQNYTSIVSKSSTTESTGTD